MHDLPVHRAFLSSRAPRRILVIHRRGRKTSLSLEEVFRYLLANPGIIAKTLAPVRKQAKEIIWNDPDMLKTILPEHLIAKKNETELMITLKNGSIWYLDGADDPEHGKRGSNVKVLHLTEAGDHDPAIWYSIYEPVLLANDGILIAEGNPRGRNWYWELYMKAQRRPDWETFLLSAEDSPIFTKDQLADIKANNPENVYNAEYLCRWADSAGVVFRTFDSLQTAEPSPAKKHRKYRIGIDIAQLQDYTVASVVDRHTWQQVHLDRFNQLSFTTIKDRLTNIIMDYSSKATHNSVEVMIEVNNQGKPIYDDLVQWSIQPDVMKRFDIFIRAFTTTQQSKAMAVSHFSMLCDQKHLRLLHDKIQEEELGAFTYKKTGNGYSYSAPSGLHDDTVMALLFSYWDLGAKLPVPPDDDSPPPPKMQWGFSEDFYKKHGTRDEGNPFINPYL